MLRNISYREKVMLIVTLVFLMAFAFYLKVLKPMKEKTANLEGQILRVENDIMRAKASISRLPQIKAELASIERELAYYETLLPTDEQVSIFLRDLETLSKSFNLRFKVFRPKGNLDFELYNQQEYTVNIIGRYDRVIHYIAALEKFQRMVNIKEMNINNANNEGKDWVDLSITIVTYTLNPGEGGAI